MSLEINVSIEVGDKVTCPRSCLGNQYRKSICDIFDRELSPDRRPNGKQKRVAGSALYLKCTECKNMTVAASGKEMITLANGVRVSAREFEEHHGNQ